MITSEQVENAYNRVSSHILKTELVTSQYLNDHLGHSIIFKAEALQVTGAFKIRGVLNAILTLQEEDKLPECIVAYSSGNHAKAIAYIAHKFNIKAKIFMPEFSSKIKMQAVKDYGAELIVTSTRSEAEELSREEGKKDGHLFLHPSDNDLVIQGAATLCYESLESLQNEGLPDAVFAAIGGGALISGSYLAARCFSNKIKIFATEPKNANDASRSFRSGKIEGFDISPKTIADGVITLRLSERTFNYIKLIDDVIEVEEEEIIYWTAWLNHLLKITVEPTAALAMAGAKKWLKQQTTPKKILILLSGGNIDQHIMKNIWSVNHLEFPPLL